MQVRERDVPSPGPGQALIRMEAAGVNFIDVYHRTGLYPVSLPHVLGAEGAGAVESVGAGVREPKPGERVAFCMVPGAYAEHALVPADRLVPIPEGLSFQQAAAVMLQGMTAHYLTHSTYALSSGDRCLVHAAAGGVGLLLVQMAKRRGATVIGTVSTEEKARLAREAGADQVILYTRESFRERLAGEKVNVVYDSVGRDTFTDSLACLKPLGMLALLGQSSGKVDSFDPALLAAGGSLFLTRPSLANYVADRKTLLARARDVLGWVASGELQLRFQERPLSEAARAHSDLEGRRTTGKLVLIPGR